MGEEAGGAGIGGLSVVCLARRSFVARAFSAISILMSPSSLKMNALKSFPAMGAQLLWGRHELSDNQFEPNFRATRANGNEGLPAFVHVRTQCNYMRRQMREAFPMPDGRHQGG